MGQYGDPRPGEAGLPNTLRPCHHVEPNITVENDQGTGYGAHQKVHVNALHVFVLDQAKGNDSQTGKDVFSRTFPLNNKQSQGEDGHQYPHQHEETVGASRCEEIVVMKWPVDGSKGVNHHDSDSEDGRAVSGDKDDCHQLTRHPGNADFH